MRIHHIKEGEDVAGVLHQVGFDAETIKNKIREKASQTQLSSQQQEQMNQVVNQALQQFTYLSSNESD